MDVRIRARDLATEQIHMYYMNPIVSYIRSSILVIHACMPPYITPPYRATKALPDNSET